LKDGTNDRFRHSGFPDIHAGELSQGGEVILFELTSELVKELEVWIQWDGKSDTNISSGWLPTRNLENKNSNAFANDYWNNPDTHLGTGGTTTIRVKWKNGGATNIEIITPK